jgi:hypothetical protein
MSIYTRFVVCLLGLFFSGPLSLAASVSDHPPPRHVEVQVTITTNGAAFPAGTYVTMSTAGHVFDAPTDQNGHATIVGDFPGDANSIVVGIPTILHWGTPEEADVKNAAAKAAEEAFSLPPPKVVTLVSGQQQYQVAFTIPEGVKVRGRAVNAQGQPVAAHAHREGISNVRMKMEEDQGKFEVLGVPKGAESFVFVGTNAIQTHIIWLTASQTQNPLDLGDVTVPAETLDSTVAISVTGRDIVRDDLGLQKKRITLIREDGRACYMFAVDDNGSAKHLLYIQSGPLLVQAGRYYIVPGMANTSDSSLKALRLIRAGQRALLDAVNVPVIEPVANQTTSASINLTTVQQAIDNIP